MNTLTIMDWVIVSLEGTIILILVVLIPCPSKTQFFVFRVLLAIGAAGFVVIIPGYYKLRIKSIKASGPIAIFAQPAIRH